MIVLGIETSCDDTSVALVQEDGKVLNLLSANQDQAHAAFGGIVPEIAGRQHIIQLLPLIDMLIEQTPGPVSWKEIDGIAVTNRPGLMGSLLVGLVTAKSLALGFDKKLIGINHLEGHILAPFLSDEGLRQNLPHRVPTFPYLALAVSGGHTSIYLVEDFGNYSILGASIDDAAGEAFDKFGKTVGLGFPGGVAVDKQAKLGKADAFDFPRALIKEDSLQMSFSGLKSAGQRVWDSLSSEEKASQLANLCASFQEAIVDVLLAKLWRACQMTQIKELVITGGVSANSRLRARGELLAREKGLQIYIPPPRFCTDNAAMIAYAGCRHFLGGHSDSLDLAASPRALPTDFRTGSMAKGRQARVRPGS